MTDTELIDALLIKVLRDNDNAKGAMNEICSETGSMNIHQRNKAIRAVIVDLFGAGYKAQPDLHLLEDAINDNVELMRDAHPEYYNAFGDFIIPDDWEEVR